MNKEIFSIKPRKLREKFGSEGEKFEKFIYDLLLCCIPSDQYSNVHYDSRCNTSDGGIDIQFTTEKESIKVKGFINSGINLYQVKSSCNGKLKDEIRKELLSRKEKLAAIVKNNNGEKPISYFYVTLRDSKVADRDEEKKFLKEALEKCLKKHDVNHYINNINCNIIYPDQLTCYAKTHIALCLRYNLYDTPFDGALTYDRWQNFYEERPFYSDHSRQNILKTIKKEIEKDDFFINIHGDVGIGKKRLTYEVLKDFKNRVLYFENWIKFEKCELYKYINVKALGDDDLKNLILVIGECHDNGEFHCNLNKFFNGISVSKILISSEKLELKALLIGLDKLDHVSIQAIIKHKCSNINSPISNDLVDGNPQLAWLVNEVIKEFGYLNLGKLSSRQKVFELMIYGNEQKKERLLLFQVLSLFYKFNPNEHYQELLRLINYFDHNFSLSDYITNIESWHSKGLLGGKDCLHISHEISRRIFNEQFWKNYIDYFDFHQLINNVITSENLRKQFYPSLFSYFDCNYYTEACKKVAGRFFKSQLESSEFLQNLQYYSHVIPKEAISRIEKNLNSISKEDTEYVQNILMKILENHEGFLIVA